MLNFAFPADVLERITVVDRPLVSPGTDHMVVMFDNGFGASILRSEFTYGGPEGLFEIVVVLEDGTPSENDPVGKGEIIGWLTEADVITTAQKVSEISKADVKAIEDALEIESITLLFESVRVAILRTDGEDDPRNPDNPALLREDANVSHDARQAIVWTTQLFIRKIQEEGLTVPSYLYEVLDDLS